MKRVVATIDYVIDLSGIFASICIFFTCFFITWGVLARYFFISAHWVEPITVYMFIATAFLTISYTMKVNEHVRVDILTSRLSETTRKILDTVLMVACFVFFIYISIMIFKMFSNSWLLKTKDLSIIQVEIWIPQLFVVIGWNIFVLSILRHIISIWMKDTSTNKEQIVGGD